MFVGPAPTGVAIFENIENNQNVMVWNITQSLTAWSFTFGDFDIDGYKEFVTVGLESSGKVYIYENTGNNLYNQIWIDTVRIPNGSDVFSGNDLDCDSKPEFFVGFARIVGGNIWDFFLYMWEATANNIYQRTFLDQIRSVYEDERRSKCGDIDGDGIDELVWSIGSRVMVYKAIGNNQFQRFWEWYNNHGGQSPMAVVNIYDMNKNGYNELIISGYGKTSIFEVEAVRLVTPNGGETYQSNAQVTINWQTFNPPRCDSLSLFYSIDNGNNYIMIAHGLSGNDTSFLWTVPNTSSDSCKIKIIAYGPGWQYDESDGIFRISGTGITEIASLPLTMTYGLQVSPNPIKSVFRVRYSLPVAGKVLLNLYDISGRLIKTLVDANIKPGNLSLTLNSKTLSSGVYFLYLQTEDKRIIERLVIIK